MISMLVAVLVLGPAAAPPKLSAIDQKVESLISQLTLEEKVSMCHGGWDFGTKAIPRLGIPAWAMSDGPGGVRGPKATYFPTGVSMAATWNPDLISQVGNAIGEEARATGSRVQLGPAINIARTPLCGRNFEYMGEDPYLAGKTAAAYVRGLQQQGVSACVKHYAANSQEIERGRIDAQIDERTLREIYLAGFETVIKEGRPGWVMAAYNKINGQYCTENGHIENDILKGEWGFRGGVMSDWGATHSTVGCALGGLDLEMPGGSPDNYFANPLLAAVQAGKVPVSVIDDKVRRLLRSQFESDARTPSTPAKINSPEHQAVAARVAEEAIVLLKNEQHLLPINAGKVKTVAVIGPWADEHHGGGGGSSAVFPPYEVTALSGLQKLLGNRVQYIPSIGFDLDNLRRVPASSLHPAAGSTTTGLRAEWFNNRNLQGTPVTTTIVPGGFSSADRVPKGVQHEQFSARFTGVFTANEAGKYFIGARSDDGVRIYVDGKLIVDDWIEHSEQVNSKELTLAKGSTHAIRVEYFQAGGDAIMRLEWRTPVHEGSSDIEEAAAKTSNADVALVFVGTTHAWDTEGSDKPGMQLVGRQAALVEAVAKHNPHTVVVLINGSPVDMRGWVDRVPAIVEAWYPGMEGGNAIARILTGQVNPSGKLPVSFPKKLEDSPAHANGDYPGKNLVLRYDEGVFVGYRYFDSKHVAPQFPFGYGLSYTTFEYGKPSVSPRPWPTVTLRVKNTGKRAGAEVVQLYVHPRSSRIARPDKELKAFQKVMLAPGETKSVSFKLNDRSFAYYNVKKKAWSVDPGQYDLLIGSSSRDIRRQVAVKRP